MVLESVGTPQWWNGQFQGFQFSGIMLPKGILQLQTKSRDIRMLFPKGKSTLY
jgi:hypothetical protein